MTTETDNHREILRGLLAPGDTVHTVLRHVSASGMTRWLDLYVIRDNELRRITWNVCKTVGMPYSTRYEALKVEGCGMDMGFHVVYELSHELYADTPEAETWRAEHETATASTDAGYMLNHRWI